MQNITRIKKLPLPNFYTSLLKYKFNYDEFVKLFNDRLKILKDVKNKNHCTDKMSTVDDDSSHFITRLIVVGDSKATRWFINCETSLFRYRIKNREYDYNFKICLPSCSNSLKIDPLFSTSTNYDISFSDKHFTNREDLRTESNFLHVKKSKQDDKLLVHFSRVSQLLANRSIIPMKGYTTLDIKQRDVLIVSYFKHELEIKMQRLKNLYQNEPDERLDKLRNLIYINEPTKFTDKSSCIEHEKFFPPCITKMLHLLRINRHLRNNDRQALSLFLKDINVPLEETIEIFRNGFNVTRDIFDKTYLYNIRHAYGLEGKKANYAAYNCAKMASLKNSQNKSMCPFLDDKEFISSKYKFDIEEVYIKTKCTERCTKILEFSINSHVDSVINTPLQYFITSKNKKKINQSH
ncbi:hypothetical protein NCER_101366 [Vairimorpha ceranae BRL01]|uniref:DNA primase large subunit C-terminal domain-containing protein n=1 Tax=Vairimorpha ceranae (strain BRL01) TaxID=578460 RepID=C4V9V1_VAIC1|nr:hypothetical protein NCER_101366 [Vairimorpha ceranae BRL01]